MQVFKPGSIQLSSSCTGVSIYQKGAAAENTHSFCKDPHKLWELMCQEGEHGCERTESSSEEDEEGKLFLGINWNLMKCCRKRYEKGKALYIEKKSKHNTNQTQTNVLT